ncbi:hypothetical protein M408DRAFT_242548 [Serendipita vermifera MAFF 305830]|uniref:C2H2-type domain-containing protein n=1 Tax=Serendipita vermifera MAFF 305830 TaxID=933852 RepID=A0A0C3BKN7_SERVB|nr:hypothetical protein M408DRAFT_242548 [Serendipita vermifera MAFF 305830]
MSLHSSAMSNYWDPSSSHRPVYPNTGLPNSRRDSIHPAEISARGQAHGPQQTPGTHTLPLAYTSSTSVLGYVQGSVPIISGQYQPAYDYSFRPEMQEGVHDSHPPLGSWTLPYSGHGHAPADHSQSHNYDGHPGIQTQGGSSHHQTIYPPLASSGISTNDRDALNDPISFIHTRFPLHNADHAQRRESLLLVINSDWWRLNLLEPDEGLLLQFMSYDTGEARWKCCFWEEGRPCPRSCKGKDHAKGHVRFHIQHSPFACEPPCPRTGAPCGKRYPTPGPLYKHRTPRAECPDCGMSMLQGNLQRHQEGPCKGVPRFDNSSANSPSF